MTLDYDALIYKIGRPNMDDWQGISYPLPANPWPDFVYRIWARLMCKRGYHLWDEIMTLEDHRLACDACGLTLVIAGVYHDK